MSIEIMALNREECVRSERAFVVEMGPLLKQQQAIRHIRQLMLRLFLGTDVLTATTHTNFGQSQVSHL